MRVANPTEVGVGTHTIEPGGCTYHTVVAYNVHLLWTAMLCHVIMHQNHRRRLRTDSQLRVSDVNVLLPQ